MSTKVKTNTKDRFIIIMAGGRGERFWPVSREKTPKQLIKLLGDRSFLQATVDRVLPLVPLKNILPPWCRTPGMICGGAGISCAANSRIETSFGNAAGTAPKPTAMSTCSLIA